MLNSLVVTIAFLAAAAIIFSKRVQASKDWQATVTPLASIIGSGFLVSVPLLASEVGNWAIFAMSALIAAAYLVGGAIRFNIRHGEPLFNKPPETSKIHIIQSFEKLSHFVLAFAYFISIAYYLVLLGNFLLKGAGDTNPEFPKFIATAILAGLGTVGFLKGLGMVERVERYAVGINLSVIAALIGGLIWYDGAAFFNSTLQLKVQTEVFSLHKVQVLLGLLIVVQGFETSRFMGDEFDAETRITSMRHAQLISAAVYILFFALVTPLFHFLGTDTGITAIINLVGHVAIILPVMLTIGAVASQFSASVADSVGAGGLLRDITQEKLALNHAYPLIALVSIAIIWNTDVFSIITLASQAFALFYFVQCCVAFLIAQQDKSLPKRTFRMGLFAALAVFCLSIVLFGVPAGA
jgi:hypothetical protein